MATWKIKDLKGVGDVELELDDSKRVFVFLGSNGVGKTKTLEAMYSLYDLALQLIYVPPEFINRTLKVHEHFEDEIELFTSVYLQKNDILSIYRNDIRLFNENGDFLKDFYHYNRTCVFINTHYRNSLSKHRKTDLPDDVELDIDQWIIKKASEVNPYQKRSKQKKNEIECLLDALNSIDNRIDKSLTIDKDIVFLVIDGVEQAMFNLSSGFKSIVRIIQSIISAYSDRNETENLLEVSGVVLIDEIENHLHLEWQTKIIPTLKNLFPNTTFYIATHSPLVLSQLSQGEAYLLNRDDDGVVRSEEIKSPNKRIFSSVLQDGFDIDLNKLKRENMVNSDQTKAKKRLLELLHETKNRQGDLSD